MAKILNFKTKGRCNTCDATIISKNFVLTAASCASLMNVRKSKVVVNLLAKNCQSVKVETSILNPFKCFDYFWSKQSKEIRSYDICTDDIDKSISYVRFADID